MFDLMIELVGLASIVTSVQEMRENPIRNIPALRDTSKMAYNGQGLLLWRRSLNVQPRTAARVCFIVEDNNYSRMLFVTLELLPMTKQKVDAAFRHPAIAASPLLAAAVSVCS